MVAPTKRRPISRYLLFPLVVAIVFLLVAHLAALERADLIDNLADRVAHSESPEAAAAVRQLAAMHQPPIGLLVEAAASPDRQVAEEARHAIGDLLRNCQRKINANRGVRRAARQLSHLAASLAEHREAFAPMDHAWIARTTRRIVVLANRVPAQRTPLLAADCDTILAAIAPADAVAATLPSLETVTSPLSLPAVREPAPAEQVPVSRAATAFAEQTAPVMVDDAKNQTQVASAGMGIVAPDSPAPPQNASIIPVEIARGVSGATPQIAAEPVWRGEWSHPLFRMLPAMPIENAPARNELRNPAPRSPNPIAHDLQAAPPDDSLAATDSRDLLQRWLVATGGDVFPLEEELTRRGFGRLSDRLVRRLFSENAQERLRLIDDVLTEPGVDARPWLLLLADDADADVRLLAVTIMATSNDAALIEKAWNVAINDRDPRIAGLASRLRERRDNARRR